MRSLMATRLIEEAALRPADAPSGDMSPTGDWMARARAAAAVAANHAAAVDTAGRFPAEAIEAAKAQRLLALMVPQSLGGEGATIADIADVCYQLAQGCAAT